MARQIVTQKASQHCGEKKLAAVLSVPSPKREFAPVLVSREHSYSLDRLARSAYDAATGEDI